MSEPQILSDVAVVKPTDVATVEYRDACPPLAVRSFGLTDPGKGMAISSAASAARA